jgi:secreted trypsin-like serine protease
MYMSHLKGINASQGCIHKYENLNRKLYNCNAKTESCLTIFCLYFIVHVPVDEQHHRIAGGSAASRGQFPWQAAIIIDNIYFCGGSLISDKNVLTAASCV